VRARRRLDAENIIKIIIIFTININSGVARNLLRERKGLGWNSPSEVQGQNQWGLGKTPNIGDKYKCRM